MDSSSSGFKLFLKRIWFAWSGICFGTLTIILTFPVILCVSVFGEVTGGNLGYVILRFWGRLHAFLSGIWVTVEWTAPKYLDGPAIYIANHGSYLDVISLVPRMPVPFRPLGKVELTKLPVFGRMYRRVMVVVDRESLASRKASVEKLKELLTKHRISILVFPEGTMNRTPDLLTPFKDGAFRIAADTGIPIIPVGVIGARENMPRRPSFTMSPGRVRLRFGAPIQVQGRDPKALKDEAYERLKALLSV
ncbi:MAG: 1-acyl-sn-glycerol-3-phosphate acyltransferase [Bdellovibrionales bacterium]|nr:1-acyl-sn-glycerol-3-phosphate acyltransferase [Bdellovibrionales bacterium]